MTPESGYALLQALATNPATLDELHQRVRSMGSEWSTAQLKLFLLCCSGVTFDSETTTYRASLQDDETALQTAILEAVRSFGGRPVPASEVRRRLPDSIVTTDEQVRAVAKRTAGLELIGPGLLRAPNEGQTQR